MTNLVYVTGEASGDRHAARLHQAMTARRPDWSDALSAWGVGASELAATGVELACDSRSWSAIGVVESLRGLRMYVAAMQRIRSELLRRKPDALILVDFGYFNVKLARWARTHGVGPVVYYMPPGSWRRGTSNLGRSRVLAAMCDLIVTPFEWSDLHLREAGANSHWLGHPMVDIVAPTLPRAEFERLHGIDPARPVVALLPGSRSMELRQILPNLLRAASLIARAMPGVQFLIAAAPNVPLERYAGALAQVNARLPPGGVPLVARGASEAEARGAGAGASVAIAENMTYDCLARADLAVVASGTATLEAAILGCPMLIVYRISRIMELEYRARVKRMRISHIGLPNIIADERIVPELLQDEATPEAIAREALALLGDAGALGRMRAALSRRIGPVMGRPGMIDRAADLIWDLIGARRGQPAERAAAGRAAAEKVHQ